MLIKTDRFLDLQSVDAIRLFSDDQIQLTSVGPMFVSSGDDLQISILSGDITADAGGAIALDSGTGDVRVGAVTTTVAAANCVVAAGAGGIFRSTSAREYKADIRDFHVDPRAVLDLKPRAFRDKGEVEKNPDTDRWHVGLVADEVADAGLHAFVDYDFDGKPESVNYDRLAVALLEVVKDQQRQIDTLTDWAVDQGFAPPPAPNVTTTDLPLRRVEPLPKSRRLSPKEPKEPRRRGDDLVDSAQT